MKKFLILVISLLFISPAVAAYDNQNTGQTGNYTNTDSSEIMIFPASYNFGTVSAGNSSISKTFTISNTGNADFEINSIIITGEGIAACLAIGCPVISTGSFILQRDNCSGQTLVPSLNCTVDVSFSPILEGPMVASLRILSNHPDTPILDIPLSGKGQRSPSCSISIIATSTVFFVNICVDNQAAESTPIEIKVWAEYQGQMFIILNQGDNGAIMLPSGFQTCINILSAQSPPPGVIWGLALIDPVTGAEFCRKRTGPNLIY